MDRRSFIKGTGSSLVVLGTTVRPAAAHSATVSPNVRLTWFGGATMQITFNGMTLLTDPCFGDGEEAFTMGDPNEMFDLAKGPNIKAHRRVTSFPRGKLKPTDLVVLSHAHEDHFDQTAAAELNPDMPFLLPPNDQKKIAGMGFKNLDVVDWSEKRTFQAGDGKIELTALPAAHSESPEIARILGKGNGYWITFSQGDWQKSLYWTGDTFGIEPVIKSVTSFGSPDLMIAHVGGVGTTGPLGKISMEAKDLQPFANAVKPQHLLAIHHSTYELYLEPTAKLMEINGDGELPLDVIASGSTLLLE